MNPPDLQTPNPSELADDPVDAGTLADGPEMNREPPGMDWLAEIIHRLEEDPQECWPAIESLSAVDGAIRVQVIEALTSHRDRPGVSALLRLLGAMRDPATRSAAIRVLTTDPDPPPDGRSIGPSEAGSATALPAIRPGSGGHAHELGISPRTSRISRSLITAIDGDGRGTIVLSASDGEYRRTAAFRCDVRRGILDAAGEVEEEHPSAGGMIDEWVRQADGDHVADLPDLAVRLLEGCYRLSGPELPPPVRAWLEATIGPVSLAGGPGATLPGPELAAIPEGDLARSTERILDACPTWLDRSALTVELAEEIALREGFDTPDPIRDAGAYRYLFEHLLIDRLELYSRMLLWMGWVWHAAGRPDLSRPAFVLAAQLSDEQYAVPSHPFTVALTTRSLRAAQAEMPNDGS